MTFQPARPRSPAEVAAVGESRREGAALGRPRQQAQPKSGGSPKVRPAAPKPHEVRLIGGLWKRSKLPVADRPGLRPTPDRVRETLFNWLGQDLTGWRCLDAFAGSGALGFEAASRGAARVLLVERDPALCAGLRQVKDRLGAGSVVVVCGDGLSAIAREPDGAQDLVFLDPPYASGLLEPALEAAARVLAPGGFIYAEADHALVAPPGCLDHRQGRAGSVWHHLFRRCGDINRG